MAKDKDTLIAWLRDAHAMEKSTVDNQERLIERLKDYPQLSARFQQHLEESRRQVERIEGCLDRLGADRSVLKDVATRAVGVVEAYGSALTPDDPVKNCLAAYATKSFEIASYTSLGAAAAAFGEPEIQRVCEESLQEERAMATWLEQHIPEVTQQYLRM